MFWQSLQQQILLLRMQVLEQTWLQVWNVVWLSHFSKEFGSLGLCISPLYFKVSIWCLWAVFIVMTAYVYCNLPDDNFYNSTFSFQRDSCYSFLKPNYFWTHVSSNFNYCKLFLPWQQYQQWMEVLRTHLLLLSHLQVRNTVKTCKQTNRMWPFLSPKKIHCLNAVLMPNDTFKCYHYLSLLKLRFQPRTT